MTKALITGVAGQDGSYLAEFLLARGYSVVGMVRPTSRGDLFPNLDKARLALEFTLVYGDVADPASVEHLIEEHKPDEIYNLAAMSFVPDSWRIPHHVFNVNTLGLLNILEAVAGSGRHTRVYQASTSEMYGMGAVRFGGALNEHSEMVPVTPYGVSKLAAHRMVEVYRRDYGIFVASGIMFNHESPRRGRMFLSRKVATAFAHLATKRPGEPAPTLRLGDLSAVRDFGCAVDYVGAMHAMLQKEEPLDLVIATGIGTRVSDLIGYMADAAAPYFGLEGRLSREDYLAIITERDPEFVRKVEVPSVIGDPRLARTVLEWRPQFNVKDVARLMVEGAIVERVESLGL